MGSAGQVVLGAVGAAAGFAIGGPAGAYYGFSMGYAVGSVVDPPNTPGPKSGDVPVQTSRDGVPIPIVWGSHHVIGNIIIQNEIERETVEEGGSKGKGGVERELTFRDFGIGVCRGFYGPIEGITRIWENDKLVYDMRADPAIPIEETLAFAEGITIYTGTEEQMPEPDYDESWGALNPYFRGLAWVAFHRKELTDFGSSIPTYRFEVNAGEGFILTSLTYPLEVVDNAAVGMTYFDNEDISPPKEGADMGFAFQSALFRAVRSDHIVAPEGVDSGFTFSQGILRQIRKDYTVDPEGADVGFTFVSGDLNRVFIRYAPDPEGADVGFTFVSGDMIDVS